MRNNTSGRLVLFSAYVSILSVSGCATTAGIFGFEQHTSDEVKAYTCQRETEILKPWGIISGVMKAGRPASLSSQPVDRIKLISPAAVAAVSTTVFIADTAQQQIFKFDRATQTISSYATVPQMSNKVSLHIDRGLSVYLTDQLSGVTTQFDIDGRVLHEFFSLRDLVKPVAAVVDDVNAEIFIADQLRAHVLIFNRNASVSRVIGSQRGEANPWQSITAMAYSNNQLFLVDQLSHQVHALAPSGKYRYAFGKEELVSPMAIAIDQNDRVFVADAASNTLKVYKGGVYETEIGGEASEITYDFQSISGIWIDSDLLYLADTNNASVKIYKILAPCL